MHPSQRELLAVLVRSARCPHPCDHMIGAPARARTADFLATTLYMRHRLHLISALVPLHTHTQRAASAPRLTVQCTHSMLPFPPAQLGALVTVVPSLITRPSPVQHLSPAPPSRGPRIRTVILNRPPHPSPHPLLKLEEAHSLMRAKRSCRAGYPAVMTKAFRPTPTRCFGQNSHLRLRNRAPSTSRMH